MTQKEALAHILSWYDPGVKHAPDEILEKIATAYRTARLGDEKIIPVYGGNLYLWPIETDVEKLCMPTVRRLSREEAQASIGGIVTLWAGQRFGVRFSSLD